VRRPDQGREPAELFPVGAPGPARPSVTWLTRGLPRSPQQREIAQLAAAGLTNKQIGEPLHLSPRTVATHLHQLLPKLGITTRAALRDALAGLPAGRV
jgi:DNA-binding NarL/FixJ family response regulator